MNDFTNYPVTLVLIAANVLISLMAFNNQDLYSKTIMWPYGVKRYNQFYRFITSGFIHADYVHLFFNMFTLFFFGQVVEQYFKGLELGGAIAYLALYFLGLIASDLPTYLKQKDNYNYHCLGASGAVSAVVFAA
ncbi:MAG TPA: rhomboid family intramembrane serine protease, partial [Chitinophagaceae bacterium]|nr:rhomboid family intramembrane serine protease [Chitinophagaceae bacterium]